MDIATAVDFLKQHQPMPGDEGISDGLIQQYAEAREALLQSHDEQVVPLVLGSFGPGTGFGLFQRMDEVIQQYPASVVVPAIRDALATNAPGTWWVLQIAMNFPDRALAEPFKRLLDSDKRDERFFAAANLESVYEPQDRAVVEHALRQETDLEIAALLTTILEQEAAAPAQS